MELAIQKRDVTWKKTSDLRKNDKIPAIVYWKHLSKNITITVDKNSFLKVYKEVWKAIPLNLVSNEEKINQFIYQIYNLTIEEISVIEKTI